MLAASSFAHAQVVDTRIGRIDVQAGYPSKASVVPGKGYFAILRLYASTEAAINKSWKPGDIERAN